MHAQTNGSSINGYQKISDKALQRTVSTIEGYKIPLGNVLCLRPNEWLNNGIVHVFGILVRQMQQNNFKEQFEVMYILPPSVIQQYETFLYYLICQ